MARRWAAYELRRGWRRQLALALLAGVVGAAVLTCLAAARRTESAYTRYVDANHGAQLEVWLGEDRSAAKAHLAALDGTPGVAGIGTYNTFFAAPHLAGVIPGQDFIVLAPYDDAYGRSIDRPIVVEGRLPRPDAPDEVFVNERAARAFHFHVGTRVPLWSLAPSEGDAIHEGSGSVAFRGARPTVTIVGIGRSRWDLARASFAQQYFLTSRAFATENDARMFGFGTLADIRVARGSDVTSVVDAVNRRLPRTLTADNGVSRLDPGTKGLRDSARVETIALVLVALAAAAVGAVMVSQAIARVVHRSDGEHATLRAIGVTRAGRVRLHVIAYLPVAIGAALVAVGIAWFASRSFPTGPPHAAEVHVGAQFDPLVLLAGAASIAVAISACVAVASLASIGPRRSDRRPSGSVVDRAVAGMSAPRAAGMRWAIRRDASGASSRMDVVGVVVGIAGLLAVVVYTTGINYAVTTPRAYGFPFDAYVDAGTDTSAMNATIATLRRRPAIADMSVVTILGTMNVQGKDEQIYAYRRVRGSITPTVVRGRAPTSDGEALLGTKTAADRHLTIGDRVHVAPPGNGRGGGVTLRIVGLGLFPTIESDQFTTGVVTTRATLVRLAGADYQKVGGYDDVVFRWKHGVDDVAEAQRMRRADIVPTLQTPAADIANLQAVRSYPRWFGVFLGLLALFATAHALISSTRRRRHEIGVLRAIGFTRKEVRRALATQGATIGAIGVVVGVPVGFALGRWAWVVNANRIGIGTHFPVPIVTIVIVAAATLGITWFLAISTGRRAGRVHPIDVLRAE